MKKSKMHQTKVSTNLEKKTRQKIATNGGCGAADLLEDFKLLGKFKKCHVRVARLNKNTLGKIGKKKEKSQRKVRATLIRGGAVKKKPGRPRKYPAAQAPANAPAKTENQAPHIEEQKQKAARSPENNKRSKEKKKRQIFIRLPFLETAKLKSLNKDLVEKRYKKAHPIKRLGKTYLTERFGSRFFRCHVKVARYRSPNDPAPKKEKFNRKSVSFLETVEVFGESDDDLPQLMNSPRTSSPAQTTCNSSDDSITISPSRRKVNLLKNTESPRSEHMRRSDEKLPRVKSVNTSLVKAKDTNNADRDAEGEEPPTVSGAEDSNEHESLNVDETEHEILPEDERVDEEDEEEEKEKHKDQPDEGNAEANELHKIAVVSADGTAHDQNDDVRTCDEDSAGGAAHDQNDDVRTCDEDCQEMSDDDKDSIKKQDNTEKHENVSTFEATTQNDVDQEGTSHQETEDDHEASNDLPREQMGSAGNNNNSNHIELSPISDHDSNMFYDNVQSDLGVTTEPDIFTEADDLEKEFSLQISNNSEMSALCQKPEENDPESDTVLSNIESMLDDTSDRPQAQEKKFSLNTFFKSLKTKIISQRTEPIPPT